MFNCPVFLTSTLPLPPSLSSQMDFPREMENQILGFPAEWDCAENAFGQRVVEVGFGCMCVGRSMSYPPMACKWTWRRISFGCAESVCVYVRV